MINFFVTAAGEFGIRQYLASRGASIALQFNIITYEQVPDLQQLPVDGTIFAAVDQLGPVARGLGTQLAAEIAEQPAVPRVLNIPARVLGRYELLRRLHVEGVNTFTAARATEALDQLRYPVFVRYDARHNGSLTPLIHDREALGRMLRWLRLRGISLHDLLVVEFCDTVGADGLYRKYSAMRVGETIVPRHVHASPTWLVKSTGSVVNDELAREELAYVESHPHESFLEQVFDLAQIEYGRVDYAVHRGRPQVWEINSNPTFGRGRGARTDAATPARVLRESGRTLAHRRLLAAMSALSASNTPPVLNLRWPDSCREQLRQEHAQEHRASRRAALLKRWFYDPVAGASNRVLRVTGRSRG